MQERLSALVRRVGMTGFKDHDMKKETTPSMKAGHLQDPTTRLRAVAELRELLLRPGAGPSGSKVWGQFGLGCTLHSLCSCLLFIVLRLGAVSCLAASCLAQVCV